MRRKPLGLPALSWSSVVPAVDGREIPAAAETETWDGKASIAADPHNNRDDRPCGGPTPASMVGVCGKGTGLMCGSAARRTA